MENMPFFISPPYQVPPMSCIFSVMLKATKFSELSPCSCQFGLVHLAPFITTKSGLKVFSSSSLGRMNMFFTKCACQATSVMMRTARRVSGLAPQKPSTTNRRLPESCLVTRDFRCDHTSGVMALLSFLPWSDHHTVSWVVASLTIYLSFGERPVKMPVLTLTAPSSVTTPRSNPSRSGRVSSAKSCS